MGLSCADVVLSAVRHLFLKLKMRPGHIWGSLQCSPLLPSPLTFPPLNAIGVSIDSTATSSTNRSVAGDCDVVRAGSQWVCELRKV